jgi:hypothetical protein
MRYLGWLTVVVSVLVCSVPSARAQGLPYPIYTPYQIKGIFVETRDNWFMPGIIGNKPGTMVTNIPWFAYEQTLDPVPCDPGKFQYAGYCYTPQPALEAMIKSYSDAGVLVTGILVAQPLWAMAACSGATFCTTQPAYIPAYGRFAAMIANRFNGLTAGQGRVVNFVIHNEVNAPGYWFDNGCGEPGQPACTIAGRVSSYASEFNVAYDGIKSEQAAAKVLVSLTQHFEPPDDANTIMSLQTFLTNFAPMVGARAWGVALHPYPQNWLSAVFSPDDTLATLGSMGKVSGWLRKTFTSTPSAWDIHLTEQGLPGYPSPINGPGEVEQSDYLCKAFQNVLGTPGIESFMYTPATRHGGWAPWNFELVPCTLDGSGNCVPGTERYRLAWQTWALANRIDVAITSCGFEVLPYIKLSRYYHPGRGHWISSRTPPAGANFEQAWKLLRYPEPGTHMLYECRVPSGVNYSPGGGHTFVDTNVQCAGWLTPMGPLGYAWDNPGPGLVELRRCYVNAAGWETHFISSSGCSGWSDEGVVGYALPF